MSSIAELVQAREDVIRASLDLLVAERNLSDLESSTQAYADAEDALALAAQRLVRVMDALPAAKQPKGWPQ